MVVEMVYVLTITVNCRGTVL